MLINGRKPSQTPSDEYVISTALSVNEKTDNTGPTGSNSSQNLGIWPPEGQDLVI